MFELSRALGALSLIKPAPAVATRPQTQKNLDTLKRRVRIYLPHQLSTKYNDDPNNAYTKRLPIIFLFQGRYVEHVIRKHRKIK